MCSCSHMTRFQEHGGQIPSLTPRILCASHLGDEMAMPAGGTSPFPGLRPTFCGASIRSVCAHEAMRRLPGPARAFMRASEHDRSSTLPRSHSVHVSLEQIACTHESRRLHAMHHLSAYEARRGHATESASRRLHVPSMQGRPVKPSAQSEQPPPTRTTVSPQALSLVRRILHPETSPIRYP